MYLAGAAKVNLMRSNSGNIVFHATLISGTVALLALLLLYPFLPGTYDPTAVPLSAMTQIFGLAGLLLVPIGAPWLIYEVWRRSKRNRRVLKSTKGYYFAITAMGAASIVVLALSLLVAFGFGFPLGIFSLALWVFALTRWIPRLKLLKTTAERNINPAPLYLVVLPLAVLLGQTLLAAPVPEFSRNRAIANGSELINEIERHRATYGSYPDSLSAVWKDYHPSVVGIDQYHYAKSGEAYSIFFEQPRFFFDNFGTREFVMYNKNDEHVMPSHVSWILLWSAEQLKTQQGWYTTRDTGTRHWKYFWFD